MRKSALILAAVALMACGRTEMESHGEVVDTTIDNSKVTIDLGAPSDTVSTPTIGLEHDTIVLKKPIVGRRPVDMKDSTRRP